MKSLLCALIFCGSASLMADGFTCFDDMSSVDGPRRTLTVNPTELGYDVAYKIYNPWTNQTKQARLVHAMPCAFSNQFDGLLSHCFRTAKPGEAMASGFKARKVETTEVGPTGQVNRHQHLSIEVYSPEVQKFNDTEKAFLALDFPLESCQPNLD